MKKLPGLLFLLLRLLLQHTRLAGWKYGSGIEMIAQKRGRGKCEVEEVTLFTKLIKKVFSSHCDHQDEDQDDHGDGDDKDNNFVPMIF